MDGVFKAINDASRRLLLDRLFDEDGQSLSELSAHLPEMTRFGVMSHLGVLEEAGLITTRREGRRKLHYLNPVPIRLIHDRWIDKYTARVVGAMAAIKAHTEGGKSMSQPAHVYVTYIAAPAEEVWSAIIDGDKTVQYFYGTRVESTWEVGALLRYLYPDGTVAADGEVLAFDPPNRLEMLFQARWDSELEAEGPVREAWVLTQEEDMTKLAVELYDLDPESKILTEFSGGLAFIVSGMKTLLETGRAMAS